MKKIIIFIIFTFIFYSNSFAEEKKESWCKNLVENPKLKNLGYPIYFYGGCLKLKKAVYITFQNPLLGWKPIVNYSVNNTLNKGEVILLKSIEYFDSPEKTIYYFNLIINKKKNDEKQHNTYRVWVIFDDIELYNNLIFNINKLIDNEYFEPTN